MNPNTQIENITKTLVDISVLMISNGANSTRTARNLKRIAHTLGYNVEHFFSHSSVVLTIENKENLNTFTIVKNIPHYTVNYSIISAVSTLSWRVEEKEISLNEIQNEIEKIKTLNSYPEWFKLLSVSLGTAALSKIFDATHIEALIGFLACMIGFWVRRWVIHKKFNIYVCFLLGAFISSCVVNFFRILGVEDYQAALTACVLWSIPGVPLINGFLDILSGQIINGWAKVAMGIMMIFMIAVGFYVSLFIFGYDTTI